jgi:hypothetical protein
VTANSTQVRRGWHGCQRPCPRSIWMRATHQSSVSPSENTLAYASLHEGSKFAIAGEARERGAVAIASQPLHLPRKAWSPNTL